MKAGQSVILINLYLFCSRLARGDKRLKNKQYPDLFFFCFVFHSRMHPASPAGSCWHLSNRASGCRVPPDTLVFARQQQRSPPRHDEVADNPGRRRRLCRSARPGFRRLCAGGVESRHDARGCRRRRLQCSARRRAARRLRLAAFGARRRCSGRHGLARHRCGRHCRSIRGVPRSHDAEQHD